MSTENTGDIKKELTAYLENQIIDGTKDKAKDIIIDSAQQVLNKHAVTLNDTDIIVGYMLEIDNGKSMPQLYTNMLYTSKSKVKDLIDRKILNKSDGLKKFLKNIDNTINVSEDALRLWESTNELLNSMDKDGYDPKKATNVIDDIIQMVGTIGNIALPNAFGTILSAQMQLASTILQTGKKIILDHIEQLDKYGLGLELNLLYAAGDSSGISTRFENTIHNREGAWLTLEDLEFLEREFPDKLTSYLRDYKLCLEASNELNGFVNEFNEFTDYLSNVGKDYFEKNFIDLAANDDGLKEIVTPIYMNGLINKDDIDKISVRLSDVNNKNNKVTVNQNSINNATNTAPIRADPIILDLNGDGIYSKNIADGTNFDFAGRRITA